MATVERGKEALRRPAEETRERARAGRGWYAWVARIGLVAKGVSYGLVGILALELALDHGGAATSNEGALQKLAGAWYGKLLLVLLALGFAAYAVWRFVQAFAEKEDEGDSGPTSSAKTWGKRAGYFGLGLIYAGLTYVAVKILTGAHEQAQNTKAKQTTATVFDWPAGRWIVGLVGLGIVVAGLWNIYAALTKQFEDEWLGGRLSPAARRWGARAGVVGHLARGVVFGLIGIFVTKAAIEYDPSDAIGLDGALRKLQHAAYGPLLLGLTAFGLVAYGVFCLVDARLRDVSARD
jgi:uncharacterized membrane protein (DUF485 family)